MRLMKCITMATICIAVLSAIFADGVHARELLTREVGQHKVVGYKDTPKLESTGGEYVVHDPDRAVPVRVEVDGQAIQGMSPSAPSDAVVLFDGTDLSQWNDSVWKIVDGAMEAGHGDLSTRQAFGDMQLHIEWMTPKEPGPAMMNRGNSGLFMMGLYELQIFGSHPVHEVQIYADGQAASIYGQTPPKVNACLAPGQWQTFDVVFKAPAFEGKKLVSPARMTVLHNGVLVHNDQEIYGPTQHCSVPPYRAHAAKMPIVLQGHGSPVRFRNIWVRSL